MATTLEDVRSDVKSTTGNGNGNAKGKKTTSAETTLLEAGSPGQEDELLQELGLEPIAELSTVTEDLYDESATAAALTEVSSQDAGAAQEVLDTDGLENLPDAYFASYDEEPPATSEAEAQVSEVVIGTDNRIRINNTSAYPWRMTCSLRMRTRTGKNYIGTGWFIGPRTVMTAGHCVYMHNEGGWAQSITVMPGRNGSNMPYGAVVATHLRSVTGWTQNRDRNSDYGCIILPENHRLGARTGWFGFAYMGDASLKQKYLNLVGYPGDKPAGTMWYHSRRAKSLTSRTIVYDIDTAGGQSGSAVYHIKNGKRYAVGIHTNGSSGGNSATRITRAVFNLMKSWKSLGS
ncbi:hypothetical protein LEM8419_03181 [Neolewinella maritima]|uniref:Serine protease n=1 Tax=Neolewinella maritima TaxID=1383882 RepID=A0ABM9B4J9_9BACT|nr:serine protease [Neolewinella maritima]CAH1002262.1 hypothetical protein LEM8419_03181 [Neolewinella maritima]